MDSRRKAMVVRRRKLLEAEYGRKPLLYSSGEGVELKHRYPKRIRIKKADLVELVKGFEAYDPIR